MDQKWMVFPSGGCFTSGEYAKAHLCAAERASRLKRPHYVLNITYNNFRCGFPFDSPLAREIAVRGYHSVFDHVTRTWIPLEEEKADTDTREPVYVERTT